LPKIHIGILGKENRGGVYVSGYATYQIFLRLDKVDKTLKRIETKIDQILTGENLLATEIETKVAELEAAVTNAVTVETSAYALIAGVSAQIQELIDTKASDAQVAAKLSDFSVALNASAAQLAAAVTANTQAA
jgi:hypothetical protein